MTTSYTTKPNDRWDLIAFAAYGDPNRFPEIVAANKGVPATDIIAGGVVILIPISEAVPLQTTSQLPPWKR